MCWHSHSSLQLELPFLPPIGTLTGSETTARGLETTARGHGPEVGVQVERGRGGGEGENEGEGVGVAREDERGAAALGWVVDMKDIVLTLNSKDCQTYNIASSWYLIVITITILLCTEMQLAEERQAWESKSNEQVCSCSNLVSLPPLLQSPSCMTRPINHTSCLILFRGISWGSWGISWGQWVYYTLTFVLL